MTGRRRHGIKEIKYISNKNFKLAEQMNKLEKAKMDKTIETIDKSRRYFSSLICQKIQTLFIKVSMLKLHIILISKPDIFIDKTFCYVV